MNELILYQVVMSAIKQKSQGSSINNDGWAIDNLYIVFMNDINL